MPQRFHVTPAQGIAQLTALLLLLSWLIKLRCRTWPTRLYFLGILFAICICPLSLAGETIIAPLGALLTDGGLALALWGIVLDTRRAQDPDQEIKGAVPPVECGQPRKKRSRILCAPAWITAGLLVAVCALWLDERFGWSDFDRSRFKGWPVLIALAAVAMTAVLISIWWGLRRSAGHFCFSRSAWLMFVAAACLSCGWYAVAISAANRQSAIDVEISNGGGTLTCDSTVEGRWNPLIYLLGYDFFATPERLVLSTKPMDTRVLEDASRLSTIRIIQGSLLAPAPVADSQLEIIGRMHDLTILELNDCPGVTDAGMQHLRGLSDLRFLDVRNSHITDEGLRGLGGLKRLRSISLANVSVNGWGFKYLSGLTNLQKLTLNATPLNDAGMAEIGKLTGLTTLDLSNTPLDDGGVVHLKNLTQLQELNLSGTGITDESLRTLQGLHQLKILRIDSTAGVSGARLGELEKSLPNCDIHY